MSKIVRLQKTLLERPATPFVDGVTIQSFNATRDVDAWLGLRTASFQGLVFAGRPWTRANFEREFAASRLWLAFTAPGDSQETIGAIALGRAGREPNDRPSLQWLMVHPTHRRRGIGAALVAIVEQAVWDRGERELEIETLSGWHDALRLYERCGYAPIK